MSVNNKNNKNEVIILSIIIVNFNGLKYLSNCIESIKSFITISYEIVLIDNFSNDGSVEFITRNYPNIILIKNNKNLGFAKANNIGVKYSSGRYLLLLNNDTLLVDSLEKVIDLIDNNLNIGVISCKMLGINNEYRHSTGFFPSPHRLLYFSSIFNKTGEFSNGTFNNLLKTTYDVDWVEGSFMLVRKDLWLKLDGMDSKYFMYGEDIDFCKRVIDLGFKVVFCPYISYIHYGGYTGQRLALLVNGFRRYHIKHSNSFTKLTANLVLTIGLILRVIIFYISSLIIPNKINYKIKFKNTLEALKKSPW